MATTKSPRAEIDVRETHLPPELAEMLGRSTQEAYTEIFRALSEPLRVRILTLVNSAGEDEFPCAGLEANLPVAKSTISYHVKQLSQAGLLTVRKEGRNFRYRLQHPVIDYFLPGFLERVSGESDD